MSSRYNSKLAGKDAQFLRAICTGDMVQFNRLLPVVSINAPARLPHNTHFLHETVNLKNVEMTKAIVNHPGFKPIETLRSRQLATLFHHITNGNMKVLEATLPRLSYQLKLKDTKGRTPLRKYFEMLPSTKRIVAWLLKIGADPSELFDFEQVRNSDYKILTEMEAMVGGGAHTYVHIDSEGKANTMLHFAVYKNDLEAVNSLLRAGASIAISNNLDESGEEIVTWNNNLSSLAVDMIGEERYSGLDLTWADIMTGINIALAIIDASGSGPSFSALIELYARFYCNTGEGLDAAEAAKVVSGKYDKKTNEVKEGLIRLFGTSFALSQCVSQEEIDESRDQYKIEPAKFNHLLNLYQMGSLMDLATQYLRNEMVRVYNNVIVALETDFVKQNVMIHPAVATNVDLKEARLKYIKAFRDHLKE